MKDIRLSKEEAWELVKLYERTKWELAREKGAFGVGDPRKVFDRAYAKLTGQRN